MMEMIKHTPAPSTGGIHLAEMSDSHLCGILVHTNGNGKWT